MTIPVADPVQKHLQAKAPQMLALLRRIVEVESPSLDRAAVNRCGKLVAEELRQVGGKVVAHPSKTTGDHLEAQFLWGGERAADGKHLMLLGHLDTDRKSTRLNSSHT